MQNKIVKAGSCEIIIFGQKGQVLAITHGPG